MRRRGAMGFGKMGPLMPRMSQIPSSTDPSKMSTIDLMRDPRMFNAGVDLLQKLNKKELSAGEALNRMGFKPSEDLEETSNDTSMKEMVAESEPLVTVSMKEMVAESEQLVTVSKKASKKKGEEPVPSEQPVEAGKKRKKGKGKGKRAGQDATVKGEEGATAELGEKKTEDQQDQGELIIRELVARSARIQEQEEDMFDEEDDDYLDPEFSAKSKCYTSIFPGYRRKHRIYRRHCKKITDLSARDLKKHYKAIRPILRDIFEGKIPNVRSDTYVTGYFGLKMLQEMSVSLPFDHSQTGIIIERLLDYFIPNLPDRPLWSDYISYVLLPEALINIFARVNEISYKMAEKEMRFRACYDDSPSDEENDVVQNSKKTSEDTDTNV